MQKWKQAVLWQKRRLFFSKKLEGVFLWPRQRERRGERQLSLDLICQPFFLLSSEPHFYLAFNLHNRQHPVSDTKDVKLCRKNEITSVVYEKLLSHYPFPNGENDEHIWFKKWKFIKQVCSLGAKITIRLKS